VSPSCAAPPDVDLLTARPGMKWSMPLDVPSIGMRVTADQLVPVAFREWLRTMSLTLQERRKRQSVHAT
jgi:hypothetical protein